MEAADPRHPSLPSKRPMRYGGQAADSISHSLNKPVLQGQAQSMNGRVQRPPQDRMSGFNSGAVGRGPDNPAGDDTLDDFDISSMD